MDVRRLIYVKDFLNKHCPSCDCWHSEDTQRCQCGFEFPPSIPVREKFSRALITLFIGFATLLLYVTRSWTLQAFVPEPYFLRAPDQLEDLARSGVSSGGPAPLEAVHFAIGGELAILACLALAAVIFARPGLAVVYLFVIIGLALITLLRLGAAFRGIH